jgi:23S rRNA (guanosine2251-2'-O)-methyltransferase
MKELLMSDRCDSIKNIFISKDAGGSIESLKAELKAKGLHFSLVPSNTLDKLLGERVNHQGVFADIGEYVYLPEDAYITQKSDQKEGFLIVLDQINDPQNFGAIIRTAYGAGADAVVITKDNSVQVGLSYAHHPNGKRGSISGSCKICRFLGVFSGYGWTGLPSG